MGLMVFLLISILPAANALGAEQRANLPSAVVNTTPTAVSTSSDSSLTTSLITEGDYSQLFDVQVGAFAPRSVRISNGDYRFQYDKDSLNSYLVQAGWALRLLDFLGGWHLEEHLGVTSFTGTAASTIRGVTDQQDLRLNLIPLDSRIMYSAEWFPWKSLVPFVDGGYEYTFYTQTGPSDLESAQGGDGHFVTGAGLRLWLNRGKFSGNDFISKFAAVPIFLTGKVSWIYGNPNDVDLSSVTYFGGLTIAL